MTPTPEQLSELKKIETEMLKRIETDILLEIHNFCEKQGLRYYLWGGTLLGAIRHNGFIPWDDDIDIAMPRKDFEIFIRTFDSPKYGVSSCSTNRCHPYWFGKAYRKDTYKIEPIYRKEGSCLGVDVDIFPLDSFSSKEIVSKSAKWRKFQIRKAGISLLRTKSGSFKRSCAGFVARRILMWDANRIAKRINQKSTSFSSLETDWMLYADSNLKFPLFLDQKWFEQRSLHSFEDISVYVPSGYDALLTACYGDYMTPPPPEKQVTHHTFQAYFK